MEVVRKQAPRLPRPAARYWKGKAPKGVADAQSESEEDDAVSMEEQGDVPIGGDQDIAEDDGDMPLRNEARATTKSMNVALKDVNISKDGRVIVAGRNESGRTALEEDDSEESEEEEQKLDAPKEESSESSEYETESEEDEKPKLSFRPVFVPKRARATIAEKEALVQETEEAQKMKELQAEERRKQSHDMVAESIRRELAEKEKEEEPNDVDDTDGIDPAGEFEAWRLRELSRIKTEKEEEIRREEEREEIERRRAMPEEQRMKEDLERANRLREEKPKGQQKFLQKYWHKGAFHQDEEILKKHDYTAPTESTLDVSLLPTVMQVRDFGKRSRTKYTHLVDQDTTIGTGGFGGTGPIQTGGKSVEGSACFACGGPHLKKDCPHITGPLTERGPPNPNAMPVGPRRRDNWRDPGDHDDTRRDGWKVVDDRPRHEASRDGRYDRSEYDRRRREDGRNGRKTSIERYNKSSSQRRSRSRSPRWGNGRRDDRRRQDRGDSREHSTEGYGDKRRRLD